MRVALLLVFALSLGGCASTPGMVAETGAKLLNDELFAPPPAPIRAADLFAMTAPMRGYFEAEIAPLARAKGPARGLYEALYSRDALRLDYDAVMTRNAAETFAARSGNCLSLAIMTSAFARELGLDVRYQAVMSEEFWTRANGIYFSSGHVNVTLGRPSQSPRERFDQRRLMTIDFMPVGELQSQRAWTVSEATVIAMYMNNRAAEVLAEGRLHDAYWFAREAVRQDPAFMAAFNTLGVIYRRLGHLGEAERAFAHVLRNEADNTHAMANLALVYGDQGRQAEAEALSRRVARLQPRAPFVAFERGVQAMKQGDFAAARELFTREVERDPGYHEFQFWLAAAYLGLGDLQHARQHLETAIDVSAGRAEQRLYAAKLAKIKERR